MYTKKISAVLLAVALATTMFAGCGKGSGDDTKDTKQQESQNAVATESIAGTEGVTETESQGAQSQYPEITSDGKVKSYQGVVAVDDAAYELYTYLDDVAGNYADSINKVASALDGKADVYDMVIPLSSEITFPDNLKDEINSSDQHQAMQDIQAKMNDKVKSVDIYDALMQHRNEYIYFRTDHHWTALGAYYAYRQFCETKGIEPEDLTGYETKEFDGFLGSFYNDTSDAKLKANPDVVTAYLPHDESVLHVTASDGTKYDWPVIYDVSNYGAGLKYSTFIASDNPCTEIENKSLTDGSSCVVVKESFGNAFIPFLVDHYQKIYVIDYRYWTGSVSKIAEEKGISVQHGVYVGVQGPTFETPAEYRMYRLLGGDAVGMSTVPEVIVARHCGIKVFGVSIITDLGGFDTPVEVSHEEVQKAANAAQPVMTEIMREIIRRS